MTWVGGNCVTTGPHTSPACEAFRRDGAKAAAGLWGKAAPDRRESGGPHKPRSTPGPEGSSRSSYRTRAPPTTHQSRRWRTPRSRRRSPRTTRRWRELPQDVSAGSPPQPPPGPRPERLLRGSSTPLLSVHPEPGSCRLCALDGYGLAGPIPSVAAGILPGRSVDSAIRLDAAEASRTAAVGGVATLHWLPVRQDVAAKVGHGPVALEDRGDDVKGTEGAGGGAFTPRIRLQRDHGLGPTVPSSSACSTHRYVCPQMDALHRPSDGGEVLHAAMAPSKVPTAPGVSPLTRRL